MGKFNNLPREIMLEILTRLPTETVLECKLVCKPWKDVVRHPSFAQLHLNHLRSAAEDSGKLGFIFFTSEQKFYYSEFDDETPFNTKARIYLINPPFEEFSFAGSCNGLICLKSWHNYADYSGPVYICNPVTRECIILPDTKGQYWLNGFGYCPSTNEYKVVRIRRYKEEKVVQVYTLGSGNGWRSVANTNINVKYVSFCPGALANGALHWADHYERTILAFQLADEKCSELPYPPCLMQGGSRYLGVLGDFLSVTCYGYPSGCEIWLLKKNKDNREWCWSKEFSFESRMPWPFGITKSGTLLCYEGYNFVCYDQQASSAKMDVSFGNSITKAIPHTNTLVSLKVLGEKDVRRMESSESASASEAMESMS